MNYTADDFANARFAEHPDGRLAMRDLNLNYHPWSVSEPHAHVARSNGDLASTGWRPVHEAPPSLDTLDTLREAWENAEVPTENSRIRRGDLVIWKDIMGYRISEALDNTVAENIRVLKRAPRAPWADLGDVLAVEMPGIEDEPRIEALAKALYREHDVRVTGGDRR